MKKYRRLLTVAGSDSGGGAGIQADLKTFAACGCYGMSAITAITAQNTVGVSGIHPVPVEVIQAQMRAVFDDIGVDGVKIGMLHSAQVIEGVAALLREYGVSPVVLDPVMVATSGDRLIEEEAVAAMQELLFPLATLLTPNIPEAELLSGRKIEGVEEVRQAACSLAEQFATAVLLKAGHLDGDRLTDVLAAGGGEIVEEYVLDRVETKNTHGTGCTLSSAIAAFLAQGLPLSDAVGAAEQYLHQAIVEGAVYELGRGHGPVHHFHGQWA